jgi:general secretion pathway protein G
MADRWDGPYLNSQLIPKDPWGNVYQYEYPPQRGQGDYPDIWSFGPDGEDGTEDDVVSWVVAEDDVSER